MDEKLASRCPNCGSTNLQTEPLYDYEEGPTEQLALFCVSCGRYMGEMPSKLKERMRALRSQLSALINQPAVEVSAVINHEVVDD
ncbi:MAG: hypothetical protein WCS37_04430 [Chloroflexota bacterium]|nr:hypothetical protein [Chloroflexota bacterium]